MPTDVVYFAIPAGAAEGRFKGFPAPDDLGVGPLESPTMSTSPVQLIAEFQCKPELTEAVEERVLDFLRRTRAEADCSSAHFFRMNEEEDRFVFFAEFKTDRGLEAHLDQEWRKGLIGDLPEMLAERPRRFTMRRVA